MKSFMKTTSILFVLLFQIHLQAAEKTNIFPDISGVWVDAPSTTTKDAYLLVSQQGSKLTMVHHLVFNDQKFIEEGKGTIDSQGNIIWEVVVTNQIPGWATAGTHSLVYDPSQNTLKGNYKDNKGNVGPLIFHKKK